MKSLMESFVNYFKPLFFLLLNCTVFFSYLRSVGEDSDYFDFVVLPSGEYLSIWFEQINDLNSIIYYSSSTDGLVWSDPLPLSEPDHIALDPILEHDDNNNVGVIWKCICSKQENYSLIACMRPNNKEWTKPVTITDANEILVTKNYKLRMNDRGVVSAMWSSLEKTEESSDYFVLLRTARGTVDGEWGKAVTVNSFP